MRNSIRKFGGTKRPPCNDQAILNLKHTIRKTMPQAKLLTLDYLSSLSVVIVPKVQYYFCRVSYLHQIAKGLELQLQ